MLYLYVAGPIILGPTHVTDWELKDWLLDVGSAWTGKQFNQPNELIDKSDIFYTDEQFIAENTTF